ncbi:MAG: hypothetical protein AAGF01_17480 [Cyanobacteria bacterium P01_G01_bin.38]
MATKSNSQYTEKTLKDQFKSFKQAKSHFGLKARSWRALADKLNSPSAADLEAQLVELNKQIAQLEAENEQLRKRFAFGKNFDEVGFWLLDRNFERAKFDDFGIGIAATEMASAAQKAYKKLAQKYHPDNGGLPEQMANVNRLKSQMLSLVKTNGGMDL